MKPRAIIERASRIIDKLDARLASSIIGHRVRTPVLSIIIRTYHAFAQGASERILTGYWPTVRVAADMRVLRSIVSTYDILALMQRRAEGKA